MGSRVRRCSRKRPGSLISSDSSPRENPGLFQRDFRLGKNEDVSPTQLTAQISPGVMHHVAVVQGGSGLIAGFDRIRDELRQPNHDSRQAVEALLQIFLLDFLRLAGTGPHPRAQADRFAAWLAGRDEELCLMNVNELAAHLGLSRSRLQNGSSRKQAAHQKSGSPNSGSAGQPRCWAGPGHPSPRLRSNLDTPAPSISLRHSGTPTVNPRRLTGAW